MDYARGLMRPPPKITVSQWCEMELVIPPPQTESPGPYSLAGREYCQEPLDDFGNPRITDEVLCFGSQTGKTTVLMGGAAWVVRNDPCGILWVMPNLDLARSFSETRWIPVVEASPGLAILKPSGSRRHEFKKTQQQIGAAIVNFIGSNSPANLASRPARRVILDEVDKFPVDVRGEADAVNLAEQRTKSFANPQRLKTSTPTLSDGLIWQEFVKGDQRRYFVPCPKCGKFIVLAWSPEYTIFLKLGCEAWVKWDKEAKRKDSWDLDRVFRSARAECPHCGGHIRDDQKTLMVRRGEWRPTTTTAPAHFRSRHLASLYASSPETTFGKLAVKFLQARKGLLGLQGFINGDLAEPWENQESRSERIEIVSPPDAAPIEKATNLLTVDVQLVAPYFWFVVRSWNQDSRLVDFGPLDNWQEIREKQLEHSVADNHVGIDSGYRAEEVYEHCLAFGKLMRAGHGIPIWVGWTPMKGLDRRSQWNDPKTKVPRPFNLGSAALPHRKFRLPLLEFSGNHLKDILARLRAQKTRQRWELVERADDEYFRHLDAEHKKPIYHTRSNRVSYEWVKRSRTWPNHLLDCEVEQIAMALFHQTLTWSE